MLALDDFDHHPVGELVDEAHDAVHERPRVGSSADQVCGDSQAGNQHDGAGGAQETRHQINEVVGVERAAA